MVWNDVENAGLLRNANNIATYLSFSGGIFMMYHCLRTPAPRSVSVKLILYIAIADFVYSIANLMSAYEDLGPKVSTFCYIEAFLRAFSHVMSIFFATCLAIVCYKTLAKGMKFDQELFFKRFTWFGVIYCILQVTLPVFMGDISYTNAELLCNITYTAGVSKKTKLLVRLGYEAFPIFSALFITLGSYLLAIKKIRQLPEEILETMDISMYKLFWYPAVLLITFAPSVVDNFGAIYFEKSLPVELKLLHLLITHSIGFTNAIVYGVQRRIDRKIKLKNEGRLLASFQRDSRYYSSIRTELQKAGDVSI